MKKLSTKQFITKFKLNAIDFEFNRKELLSELNNHFLLLIEEAKRTSKESKEGFTYKKFKNCIDETENKFWAISNKKEGMPFTLELWNAFYAVYIVKAREEYFPDIQREISEKRLKHLGTLHLYTLSNGIEINLKYVMNFTYILSSPTESESVRVVDVKVLPQSKFSFRLTDNNLADSILLNLDQIKKLVAGEEIHWVNNKVTKTHLYLKAL
jgi:hypothetical protein